MSTAASNQDNQCKAEHHDSPPALFYLCREVSKLAAPIHAGFLDKKKADEVANDDRMTGKPERVTCSSLEDPLVRDGGAHLLQSSRGYHRRGLCCMMPYSQGENGTEEGPGGGGGGDDASTSRDPRGDWTSPWTVLSLINLHCERLLHDRDAIEPGFSLGLSASAASHLNAAFAAAGVTAGGSTRDGLGGLQLCEGQKSPLSTGAADTFRAGRSGGALEGGGPPHAAEERAPLTEASHERSSAETLWPPPGYKETSSDDKQLESNQEGDTGCLFTGKHHLQQAHPPGGSASTQITFSSAHMERIDGLKLDHNANITWSTQLTPRLLSSQPGSVISDAAGVHRSPKASASKPECFPLEVNHTTAEHSLSSATSPELWRVRDDDDQLSGNKCRTKTRRKQPHPSRSADVHDPDFQGVFFRIDAELDDSRERCRLLITSKHSKQLCRSVRKPKLRARTSQKSATTSSSEEDNDQATNINKGKVCASCCTRKTPMWRDAEDGTPLCNACGIRYKKYRVRCVKCWHIPRKEGNSNSLCIRCGNFVRLTSAQRKHHS
uniref:Zinc finger GATA like protein 1 n=2 Tax=Fundulus heteroclitus TaxID=8078 RepID=A0A3Q2QF28_FUNHE